MIRTIWVGLLSVPSLMAIGATIIIGSYVGAPRGLYDWAARTWCGIILWASGTPVRVIGAENVRTDRAQVITVNHQSMYDVFAVARYLPARFHFVAKKELARIPVFGRAARAAGHVFIDRDDRESAIRSLELAGQRMKEEKSSAILFPEGTRSPTGDLRPFKKGPFILALKAGVPIVPTVVDGTREILPKRGFRIRPRPITIRFGEPIETADYDHDRRDALVARVHARMAEMLAELRHGPAGEGPRFVTPETAGTAAVRGGAEGPDAGSGAGHGGGGRHGTTDDGGE